VASAKKTAAKNMDTIADIAREATTFNCDCGKLCLASVGSNAHESMDMLTQYMLPWINMDQKEHKEKFFPLLEGCSKGVTPGGHFKKWYVPAHVCYVCHVIVCMCHGVYVCHE
jgi:hypothetical protein